MSAETVVNPMHRPLGAALHRRARNERASRAVRPPYEAAEFAACTAHEEVPLAAHETVDTGQDCSARRWSRLLASCAPSCARRDDQVRADRRRLPVRPAGSSSLAVHRFASALGGAALHCAGALPLLFPKGRAPVWFPILRRHRIEDVAVMDVERPLLGTQRALPSEIPPDIAREVA